MRCLYDRCFSLVFVVHVLELLSHFVLQFFHFPFELALFVVILFSCISLLSCVKVTVSFIHWRNDVIGVSFRRSYCVAPFLL